MSRCFVAQKRGCKCVLAALVDDPKLGIFLKKQTGRWIADGFEVDTMLLEDVVKKLAPCRHGPRIEPPKQEDLVLTEG